jgi:hypothetical protein
MSTYVQVMVPEEQLAAVYRVLLSAHEAGASRSDPAAQELVASTAGGWRDPAFVRLHLGARSETIRRLAKYLADRPGQAVTAEAAADALSLPYGWNSLAGALGAFGNYLANRGIEFPWSAVTDANDERVRLTMDEDTATAVKQAL